MKINSLKVNGFGKLKDRQVDFTDGINIIFGENESGKSSMLKFISGMLYGTSKNKNGKEISDFEKYKPWDADNFSGKINYTLDDGKTFEVYREFKKKNPIIYNSNKEDISSTFTMDKSKGINFFTEQTNLDEETFYSTAITEQEGMKLSKSSQNSIIQKISNLVSSGDDNISYKKAIDKIIRNQNEEVGTERTSQRPINIVENKIRKLMEQKRNLEIYKDSIYDNSLEKEQLKMELDDLETKKSFLKDVKNKLDNNRLKNAELNFNKNLENEYEKKIEELNKKIANNEVEKKYEKINFRNYYISLIVLIITFIILMATKPERLLNFIVVVPIVLIMYKVLKERKNLDKTEHNRTDSTYKIVSEINILKENIEKQRLVSREKESKLKEEIEKEKDELTDKYIKKLDLGFIDENIEKSYDELLKEIEDKEKRINTIKFKLQTMEISSKDINDKLDNLAAIEEELDDAKTEKEELLSLNNSYNIAKECLEKAYNLVKENISPKFTNNLCEIISKISDNRYSNVILSDTEGLKVELPNGNYIPASRLSVGTIDQMYLSLRLSALKEVTQEKMPIILDEAFAYFDNERLENILKYLNENFSENQIIIFTCSKREEEILEKLNITYNIVNL
ncbi:MAG TPA: AAA family ATPase [Candidatus Scatovivens faecipullorum]|nr:AAA family ATPase [Candidatus Scatovivens faecipullorum]